MKPTTFAAAQKCIVTLALLAVKLAVAAPGSSCASPTYNVLASIPADAPFFPRASNPNPSSKPSKLWGKLCGPLPTNSWWTNLMLSNGAQLPVLAAPYLVKAPHNGLEVGYPYPLSVSPSSVNSPFSSDWSLSASEGLAGRQVVRHDPLTVTLAWTQDTKAATKGHMRVPLAQGSPYATAFYTALTPRITTAHAVVAPAFGTYTASAFTLTLSNGQVWCLYFCKQVTFTLSIGGLSLASRYTGALRLALVPNAGALAALEASANVIPTNSSISAGLPSASEAAYIFRWGVQRLSCAKGTPGVVARSLLMLAMPHHVDAGVRGSGGVAKGVDGAFKQLLGPYKGILGRWTIKEKLQAVDWQAPRAPAADKVAALKASLGSEQDLTMWESNIYFGSSQAAAIGQQALIADMLDEPIIANKLRTYLKTVLDQWLAPRATRFVYDTTWGGVFAGVKNGEYDSGSAFYNDHHFCYGYLMYAAAALGTKDPAWLKARTPALLNVIRDFANPRVGDPYFPFARQMDFYAGHSWASGLWGVWDVKNQESSSEAVHSYYALALLAKAMGKTRLEKWGRLLMAMEIRAARKYYHITSASTTFPAPFKSNKVVGILWATKADYSTFFGTEPEKMHVIQHIPYRPHTEFLLPASWIRETLPILGRTLTRPDPPNDGFKAFIFMAHAIVDKEWAWNKLQGITWAWNGPYAACTKTQALWWAATRP